MKRKKLLYLDDLYEFYSTHGKSHYFNNKKENYSIVVQVPGKLIFDSDNKHTEGLLKVHLQACHTKDNINGSNISDSVMESALPSFYNRPILGFIHFVDNQPEFYGHNMHEDDNGETIY